MIRRFASPLRGLGAGPYAWRREGGEAAAYPVEAADAEGCFAVMDCAAELPAPAEVFALLHGRCAGRRMQLGLAESCTGGLVGASITEFPGSSAYFYGGWMVYSNHAKFEWLQVSPHDLREQGAVSRPVVADLLRGIFAHSPCTHGLAVSGVAGPDGGSPEKPVGTVWIGAADRAGAALVREFRFGGDRRAVREAAACAAGLQLLELLWLREKQIDMPEKL